ncbi:MAG: DsbA family protein, partial [Mesorhizobium sp.]
MNRPLSRRNLLSSLAAIPAVAFIAACSDSEEEAKAADAKPANPATPAAAKVPEAQGTVDMAQLLKPGALPEKQLGKDDAKVTIVEYASMTCPHCAHFNDTTFPELKTKYIDTGKARYI